MYHLIALASMAFLGSYATLADCETAVREIYQQKIDPYRVIEASALQQALDTMMQYRYPREFKCSPAGEVDLGAPPPDTRSLMLIHPSARPCTPSIARTSFRVAAIEQGLATEPTEHIMAFRK